MKRAKVDVSEVFSSIQGEGIFAGVKQIFIRFNSCNLSCRFCDEAKNPDPKSYSTLELFAEVVALYEKHGKHHSVSLTGGEPLLHADFLDEFLPVLKESGFSAYLETNGTLPSELSRVIGHVDMVAMDFKLPSSTGERAFWNEHLEFLKIASKKNVFVKAVVTAETSEEDIDKAISLVKKVDEKIYLVLQPATPVKKTDKVVPINRINKFLEVASKNRYDQLRVLPQMHKVMKVK